MGMQKLSKSWQDNPNAPDDKGWSPMHWIAGNGYTEIFKFLAPLTDNPNPPNKFGRTPYAVAGSMTKKDIQKLLQTYETSRKHKTGFTSAKPSKKQGKKF